MSSKLTVKQGKKDRPKSSDRLKGKRRDGTPDKSATPSQDLPDENRPTSRQIISQEELETLRVKNEELEKLTTVPSPSALKIPQLTSITVRKKKPVSETKKLKTKSVMVARPAPSDAELKPIDYSGYAGPRYDKAGCVIPYSILGSYDDFRREAVQRGDLLDIPTPRIAEEYQSDQLTVKYEKKRTKLVRADKQDYRAMRNWQEKMWQRKRQQGYISKLLQKAPEDLVMNQADSYRQTQEDRHLIDRTIPFLDNGKGFRVGSEFWKQQELFGDELSGIHVTLTQTEKGYPPPVEYVGLPDCTRIEKGVYWDPEYRTPAHSPWYRSRYLQQRRKQLQPLMDELSSHKPDFTDLQIIGSNQPVRHVWEDLDIEVVDDVEQLHHLSPELRPFSQDLSDRFHDYPQDIKTPPIFGPSLQFAGQAARWTGDSYSTAGQTAMETRVTFETQAGTRSTSFLEVLNDGTTAIFIDWKKIPKENPFDFAKPEVQKFYFNNSSGVVLPGETLRLPFLFKSECAGVFTEQWALLTRPVLCGGADLLLTLRGVAVQADPFQTERAQMEQEMEVHHAQQLISRLLEELVSGIRTPLRPSSPEDSYVTEEQLFHRHNPGLFYRHDTVTEMKRMHQQLVPEVDRDTAVWGLCVQDLMDIILELDDEDERKEPMLSQLNAMAADLSYAPRLPMGQTLEHFCHKFLSEAVDSVVTQSAVIRQSIGLPSRDMTHLEPRTSVKKGSDGDSRKSSRQGDKSKTDSTVKDKKSPSLTKESKPAKTPVKEPVKPDPKVKAAAPSGSRKASLAAARSHALESPGSVEVRPPTPPSTPSESPVSPEQEQALDRKYKEQLYTRVFLILGEKMDQMDGIFQHILQTRPSPKAS